MDIIVVDWESYYDPDIGYTLSKLTTEEYVRDPRFETILVSIQINHDTPFWVPQPQVAKELRALRLERNAMLCHHSHFDGLIAYHHYGISPRLMLDTLGMARALYGANGRLSLEKLSERHGIGVKGTEVHNVKGMRFADFDRAGLARYGDYSVNDSVLTRKNFDVMAPHFSREEFEINDLVIRMFTEPEFVLDVPMLQAYAKQIRAEKTHVMLQAGVQEKDLMSNARFAAVLEEYGIEVPMKVSPTWLKKPEAERGLPVYTYAFAKTDLAMQQLQAHPDERVQILVEARLKNKTTIAEKGALRLEGMAGRGRATIYYKYSGASGTHRLSGGDKFNWQAMKRGSDLRNAVMAPEGYVVVVADSSTIEARLLDWLAGQEDMVEVYRKQDNKTGPDMYCVIAEKIYERPITKAKDPDERQMGKRCLAEGTLVLTDDGLVPIESITRQHRVWDGVEWVHHDGVICNGEREVIEYQGLWATPDHEVFTEDGRKIPFGQAASQMVRIIRSGHGRRPLRGVGNRVSAEELGSHCRTARVYDIVNAGPRHRFTANNLLVHNCKLGLGFGMGPERFAAAVREEARVKLLGADGKPVLNADGGEKMIPLIIPPAFAKRVVTIYRDSHKQVQRLWRRCDQALEAISKGQIDIPVDYRGIVRTCKDGLVMPGGLKILYPDLKRVKTGEGNSQYDFEWEFWNGKTRERIHGRKVTENIIQCLARITVFKQCLDAAKEVRGVARWKLSSHDEGGFISPEFEAPWVLEVLMKHMRTPPVWAPDLPVNCEGGFNKRYGQAK